MLYLLWQRRQKRDIVSYSEILGKYLIAYLEGFQEKYMKENVLKKIG